MSKKRLIVVSGLSGSGKSTVAKALEDSGFYVVDNLPMQLFEAFFALFMKGKLPKELGVVVDSRDKMTPEHFPRLWQEVQKQLPNAQLIFLEASDAVLARRFTETRRKHPLEQGRGLIQNIAAERVLLKEIAEVADQIISTEELSVHRLKEITQRRLFLEGRQPLLLGLMSFGFKYGVPQELDMCFDARFLPNPFFDDALKKKNGLEKSVSSYVLKAKGAAAFLDHVEKFVKELLPAYTKEGKSYLTVAIGCTGGFHRSVSLVQELARRLKKAKIECQIEHRDL